MIDFSSHGLDYTRELCCAIESYTASMVRRNPNTYNYRGMQLRYAVERDIYILCINSEALFSHYLAHRSKGRPVPLPLNPLESDIAFHLLSQGTTFYHPPKRMIKNLLKMIRLFYNWLCQQFQPPFEQSPTQRLDVLIHVVNNKFVDYLDPITRELDIDSYAYLTTNNSELFKKLKQTSCPVVRTLTNNFSLKYVCSYSFLEFYQLMLDANAIFEALRALRPRCVLVVEGNAPMDIITAEASRVLGIPCFCVQQGWSPYVHTGFRNMNYTEMFVWGQRFADLLRPYNPRQVFRVTGSHVVSTQGISSSQPDSISTLSFFLQSPCALLGNKAFLDFIDLIISVAQAYPHIRIILREHPSYRLSGELRLKFQAYSNIHFSFAKEEPLAEVLIVSDLVISVFSTVILESIAMNVVPLICSIGAMRHYEPAVVSAGAAIEVQSIMDARRVIHEVIADPTMLVAIRKNISKVSQEFFSSGDAVMAIIDRLRSAGRKSTNQSN